MSLYLYHATDRKNLDSIMQNGLLVNPPSHNWEGMYCDNQLFLALNYDAALAYAESADNPPEDIVVLKVKLDVLNDSSIAYDWNNRCEYTKDINSIAYRADISGNCLQIASASSEPDQTINSFKGTDLYDTILNTFDNEVETNMESY